MSEVNIKENNWNWGLIIIWTVMVEFNYVKKLILRWNIHRWHVYRIWEYGFRFFLAAWQYKICWGFEHQFIWCKQLEYKEIYILDIINLQHIVHEPTQKSSY